LKCCKQLRCNLAATRLEEITQLAKQALALTTRGWYGQYIDREAAKVGVFSVGTGKRREKVVVLRELDRAIIYNE
jgi:hypothetical protein